jgi:hypothetical protein
MLQFLEQQFSMCHLRVTLLSCGYLWPVATHGTVVKAADSICYFLGKQRIETQRNYSLRVQNVTS